MRVAKPNKNDSHLVETVESADRHGNRRVAGQDPAKRQQILEGAKRVFMKVGFDTASMNDITREAGVSKGTIYVYFENKEDLFGALIERERNAIFRVLADTLETGGTLRETLARFGILLTGQLTSEHVIKVQRMVIAVTDRMPKLGANFYAAGPGSAKSMLFRYLDAQVVAGRLDIPSVSLAGRQFFELCMAGAFRACLFGAREAPPTEDEIVEAVESAVEMFLARYGTDKADT